MQCASVTQDGKDQVVMWTELSRFRLGKRTVLWICRKRRECHAEPRTSWPAKREYSPIDKSLFRGIYQFQLYAASRRRTLISKFSKRDSNSLLFRSNYRSSVRQVNSCETVDRVAAGGAFKHIHFQLRQHIHGPSGLICVIKKNSLWDEYRHSFDYNSPA